MKTHKKSRLNPIMICMLMAALICGMIGPSFAQPAYAAKKIKLSKSKITLKKGQSKKLSLKKGNKKMKNVKWKSSNKKVVSVTSSGKIKARKVGKATITAKYKNKNYKCKVTVKKAKSNNKKKDPIVEVPKITVTETKIPRKNADGSVNTIYGKLYAPAEQGKYPAIILCHGYNGIHADFSRECAYYAQNGYIAYAFDFCGGSARSKSTGPSTAMTVTSEKSDLLAVFDYISALESVDANHVFMMGGSQGGLVAALAAEERADKIAGTVLYFPAFGIPDDWRGKYSSLSVVPKTFDFWGLKLGKCFVEDLWNMDVFSTIGKANKKDVLILQGDKDNIAPLAHSQKAQKIYSSAELVIMKGQGHGFTPVAGTTAMKKVLEFMNNHTK